MDTQTEKNSFYQNLFDIREKYLAAFPDEDHRLAEFTKQLDNQTLDLRLRSTIPEGHMCASGIILLPNGSILMLEHKALGIWVVPGGHYDLEDKDLTATAIRETQEETSLTGVNLHPWHVSTGIPLDIDTHPIPAREEKHEGAHQHFDFRYILTVDDPDTLIERIALDTNEVLNFKTFTPDSIDPTSSIAPALRKLTLITQPQ